MVRRVLFCLVAGLVLTACSTGVEGTPAGDPRLSGPLDAEKAFGDLRTIDPCTMTGPYAFEDHGEAQLPAKVTMDECVITVLVDDAEVTVELGLLQHVDVLGSGQEEVRRLPGDARVVKLSTQDPTKCEMALVLADDIAVSTVATPVEVDSMPVETVCALAQDGAEGIAEAVRTDLIQHWEPPTNSLARQSACQLLAPDQVASLLGITPERVSLYPAEHQCRWGRSGGDTATVKLDFPVGADPGTVGVSMGSPVEEIGGRTSWVDSTGTETIGVCNVTTEHIPFGLEEGEREYAVLRVAVPATAGKDACAIGRQLAASAWAKLPAAE